jgi:hypothetical protein
MAKGSYNSVGAGETPNCFHGKTPAFMEHEVSVGGGQDFAPVTASVDVPKVARPGGYGKDMGKVPGSAPKVARPGGAQGI